MLVLHRMDYSTLRVLNIFKAFKAPPAQLGVWQANRVKNKQKKIYDVMMSLDVNC